MLILGGTAEASGLARLLAREDWIAPILSLAGRTAAPVLPPIPHRIGGFGGTEGLGAYLRDNRIEAVIDATHPFAARISANAAIACARAEVPLATFTRAPWRPEPGDRWRAVPDLADAAEAIGRDPVRVLLTTGRLGLAAFKAAPQHFYLIRTIYPPEPDDCPPRRRLVLDRGPFPAEAEAALMRREAIDVLVTKNSGGGASFGKIEAARRLGLPVIMVERPPAPGGTVLTDLDAVEAWIGAHRAAP